MSGRGRSGRYGEVVAELSPRFLLNIATTFAATILAGRWFHKDGWWKNMPAGRSSLPVEIVKPMIKCMMFPIIFSPFPC